MAAKRSDRSGATRLRKTFFAMTILVVAFANTLSSASANEFDTSSESAVDIYSDVANSYHNQTDTEKELDVIENPIDDIVTVADRSTASGADEVSIDIIDASGLEDIGGGFFELSTNDTSALQLVQALPDGFRIVNVLMDSSSKTTFEFRVNLPDAAKLELIDGTVQVILGNEVLGSLKQPWAFDSAGSQLSTHFSVIGNVIYQHIRTESSTVFPVVADPYWGYVYSYALAVSPETAWNKLHKCFNCYFPVSGAPSIFPTRNQLLPLKVWILSGFFNMECRMGQVTTSVGSYSWQFNATSNHVDGLGSNIIFQIRTISGKSTLVVDAYIVKDFPLTNSLYKVAAQSNWTNFAANLSR